MVVATGGPLSLATLQSLGRSEIASAHLSLAVLGICLARLTALLQGKQFVDQWLVPHKLACLMPWTAQQQRRMS